MKTMKLSFSAAERMSFSRWMHQAESQGFNLDRPIKIEGDPDGWTLTQEDV